MGAAVKGHPIEEPSTEPAGGAQLTKLETVQRPVLPRRTPSLLEALDAEATRANLLASYKIGDEVWVILKAQWYSAVVTKLHAGFHNPDDAELLVTAAKVHYLGFKSYYDEWVMGDSMMLKTAENDAKANEENNVIRKRWQEAKVALKSRSKGKKPGGDEGTETLNVSESQLNQNPVTGSVKEELKAPAHDDSSTVAPKKAKRQVKPPTRLSYPSRRATCMPKQKAKRRPTREPSPRRLFNSSRNSAVRSLIPCDSPGPTPPSQHRRNPFLLPQRSPFPLPQRSPFPLPQRSPYQQIRPAIVFGHPMTACPVGPFSKFEGLIRSNLLAAPSSSFAPASVVSAYMPHQSQRSAHNGDGMGPGQSFMSTPVASGVTSVSGTVNPSASGTVNPSVSGQGSGWVHMDGDSAAPSGGEVTNPLDIWTNRPRNNVWNLEEAREKLLRAKEMLDHLRSLP
ncbi:hypothetical protein BV898_11970 [Hypsibius exemplaris]|uniref:Tudor-knot domain-containing protein n=1 Tax=Hypsibius exemplaris TaxID=2072580 RepID=A0A1W0WFH0_HYPEX|nr:hypothetical protein BV898_11970 [Hypsibius exemplaris]